MPNNYLENPPLAENELMAAIDIGSNSFHLAIGRLDHGEVRKVVSMSEKVQLAAGLDEHNILSAGGRAEAADLYVAFRGRLPGVEALLKGRGLAA